MIHRDTYLIRAGAEYKQVKRDCCHHVYKEPALKVMDGNLSWIADHLLILVHVGGPEVNEDVDDEHDVHDEIDHVERAAGVSAFAPPLLLLVVEEEGGRVRSEDGRVDDQQQDQPVPNRFERAVVQDGELVDARRLELVLRQHVSSERKDLGER